jgi:RNA polymerase sigma-70 factor (ECF subfamily)
MKRGILSAMEGTELFEQLMAYREDIFRICLGYSRNPSDAEDLSQDVYLKAFRGVSAVLAPYAAKEWLFRITRNTCLDHLRKARLNRLLGKTSNEVEAVDDRTPERTTDAGERLAKLKKAIRRLPVKQREVFILRTYGHLSYRELALTLGIKEGTVMSRLSRARRMVLHEMSEDGHGKK